MLSTGERQRSPGGSLGSREGVNFTNILRSAFRMIMKAVIKFYICTFLAERTHKMKVKFADDVNFTNILNVAFVQKFITRNITIFSYLD